MGQKKRFEIFFDVEIILHLRSIARKYHPLIREKIDEQLSFEPDIETKNRKPLQRSAPFPARWELRFGPNNRFRVFYHIEYDENAIFILAIGEKRRNQLSIGGKVVEL